MKGYIFYLEYPTTKDKKNATRKMLGNHSGNVIAVFGKWYKGSNEYQKECISSQFEHSNSVCCGGSVGSEYLTDRCKRISEKQAREIHENLFNYFL